MRALAAAVCLALSSTAFAQSFTNDSLLVSNFLLSNSISDPTGIRFTGANQGFVIEKGGAVKRFNNGALSTVLDLSVATNSERGLLGIAIDPGYAQNGHVYLYYSAGSGSSWTENRLARYTWDGNSALINPVTLATFGSSSDGQENGPNHNGGPLVFGKDGKLYGTTGDLNRSGIEQNQSTTTSAYVGGVYRLNPDGSVPQDNPFASNPNQGVRPWYTYGVRNSFGLAVDPVTGHIWNTENGPAGYDEINLLSAGMNSGWTPIMGPDSRNADATSDLVLLPGAAYQNPQFSFAQPIGITSLHFLHGSSWGAQYNDAVLVGENNQGRMWLFRLNEAREGFVPTGDVADGVLDPNDAFGPFGTGFDVVTDIQRGPDGAIYIAALGADAVYRVAPIPEPTTWVLTLAGLGLVVGLAARRQRRRQS